MDKEIWECMLEDMARGRRRREYLPSFGFHLVRQKEPTGRPHYAAPRGMSKAQWQERHRRRKNDAKRT